MQLHTNVQVHLLIDFKRAPESQNFLVWHIDCTKGGSIWNKEGSIDFTLLVIFSKEVQQKPLLNI